MYGRVVDGVRIVDIYFDCLFLGISYIVGFRGVLGICGWLVVVED